VLWLGGLRSVQRRASQADRQITLPVEPGDQPIPVGPVGAYLYEPDPAAIRAGAIAMLAGEHRLWKLDEEIAYLTGDCAIRSPWLRGYRVLEALPFSLKPLRAALRARGVADVVVKKRGSAVEPEALRRRLLAGLPRPGVGSVVLILARQRGDPWALVTEAVAESGGNRRGEPSDGLGANG